MTHLSTPEWGRVAIGPGGFSTGQADALIAAARAHPLGGADGGAILTEHRHHLRAQQMVGVIAARGCSLEILPKADPDGAAENGPTVRRRLVSLIDLALGLDLGDGAQTAMARGADHLLDMLIRIFAQRLIGQTRRGLPRLYQQQADDLPVLRGRMDVARQFTIHAVRPDRIACHYDHLSSDTPLMQVMKAAVVMLARHARAPDTRRLLDELRFVLADVADVPASALPWARVRIDRTNRSWASLFALARLLVRRDWQGTGHDARVSEGLSLLFPMNDLFEQAIATLLRRALAGRGLDIVAQGGLRYCLGEWDAGADCAGHSFQTRPDLLLRRGGKVVAIIDTKWKRLAVAGVGVGAGRGAKQGVAQADIYQMMAYARLYDCHRLMLLYPAAAGAGSGIVGRFGLARGREMLALGQVDMAAGTGATVAALRALIDGLMLEEACLA